VSRIRAVGIARVGWSVVSLLASLHAIPARGTTTADALTTAYEVHYGPLTVLSVQATTELFSTHYRATAEMKTVGIAGLLFPWRASASSKGRQVDGNLQPITHRASGEYRGQQRSVAIDYGDMGSVMAAIHPPPEGDYRDAVPVTMQQATIDPLTATLSVLRSECRGAVRVFDGRRRYDLRLSDLGEAEVATSRGLAYAGRARRCRGEISPLAGFWRPDARHDERPTQLDYWIASPRPGLPPVPVYLELSSQRGTLSVHLTSVAATASASDAPEGK